MVALKRAFDFVGSVNSQEFYNIVFHENKRPSVENLRAPPSIIGLIPNCWSEHPEYRLDMENVSRILRTELILLHKGDASLVPDQTRRRSTFIFSRKGNRKESLDDLDTKSLDQKSLDASIEGILDNSGTKRSTALNLKDVIAMLDLSFRSDDGSLAEPSNVAAEQKEEDR
jgi:hypothetical protein